MTEFQAADLLAYQQIIADHVVNLSSWVMFWSALVPLLVVVVSLYWFFGVFLRGR